jgi:hypothetical protein
MAEEVKEIHSKIDKTVISVLLPTRGRTDLLKKSLESLISHANDPTRIEILLGLDDDDEEVRPFIEQEIAPYLQEQGVECRANIFEPLGYSKLHVYVNTLASSATGQWLFFWNDDALMETQGWDDQIESKNGQFKLFAPHDNHAGHPYAILPIIPMDWFRLMDHLSMNSQNDAWLSHVAYMLDIFERIDINFLHDRADLTGNNDDETFKARSYSEGNPSDPADFGHADMQNSRVRTAYKIAWYLDKIGQHSDWWDNVQAGTQDPFEKMIFPDGVKGAGQLDAGADVIPDDVVLEL